jgi:hypothetical protein
MNTNNHQLKGGTMKNINIMDTAVCYFRSATPGPGIAEQEEVRLRVVGQEDNR